MIESVFVLTVVLRTVTASFNDPGTGKMRPKIKVSSIDSKRNLDKLCKFAMHYGRERAQIETYKTLYGGPLFEIKDVHTGINGDVTATVVLNKPMDHITLNAIIVNPRPNENGVSYDSKSLLGTDGSVRYVESDRTEGD